MGNISNLYAREVPEITSIFLKLLPSNTVTYIGN